MAKPRVRVRLDKGMLYGAVTVLSLVFMINHVYGYSLGDSLLELAGISPWTEPGQNGFHLTVIIGFIGLAAGCGATVVYYRKRNRRDFCWPPSAC
ncbi:MAG: hypothetical protein K0R57_859 [Paenibacillaceae bacterium]|nr:hypothetical protein [Paenibacillaceae bacterium]